MRFTIAHSKQALECTPQLACRWLPFMEMMMTEFKIGDKVKYSGWNSEHAGKKGTVTGMRDIAYRVDFNEYEYQYAKSEELTLLPTPTTTHQFKEGDKVRVVGKIVPPDWENSWTKSMNDYIGKEFTVDYVSTQGVHFVDKNYGFPPESLELISNQTSPQAVATLPAFKVGDHVQYIGGRGYSERVDNATGIITESTSGMYYWVAFDNPAKTGSGSLGFYAQHLKLLEPQTEQPATPPVPVFKIGDRVQAIGSSRYSRMDNAVGTVVSIQDYCKGPYYAISLDPPFSEVNRELSWFEHELKLLPAGTPVVESFDWSLLECRDVVTSKQCCTREDAIKWARQEVASITGEDGTFTLTQHTPVMTFTKTSKIEETTHE